MKAMLHKYFQIFPIINASTCHFDHNTTKQHID